MKINKYNADGYKDLTFYEAMKSIEEKERKERYYARLMVKELKTYLYRNGYELINRIEIKHIKSGFEYK